MNNDIIDSSYFLRLVGINKEVIDDFKYKFPNLELEVGKYFKDKSKFVFSFKIDRHLEYEKIKEFLLKHDSTKYERVDIFISFTSHSDNYIVEFPDYVLTAIRWLPVKVNVSFIYLESS